MGVPVLVAIAIVAIGLNLALDWQAGTRDPLILGVKALAIGASAAFPILSYRAAEARYRESESERRRRAGLEHLSRVVEASVRRLFPDEDLSRIRANVMLGVGDELKLLCSWNMEAYPDARLVLRSGVGVAGKLWKKLQEGETATSALWPVFAPKAQMSRSKLRSEWGLDDNQIEATAHILWILSVPMVLKQGETVEILGVLNIDGVKAKLKRMGLLKNSDFWRNCMAAAEHVAREAFENGLVPSQA